MAVGTHVRSEGKPLPQIALRVTQFMALLLVGTQVGVSYAHLLQLPGKRQLPIDAYILVQNVVIKYKLGVGILEYGGVFFLVGSLLLLWQLRETTASRLTATALGLLIGMILVWAIWIEPINQRIDTWTPQMFPQNWTVDRDQWHALHIVRLLLGTMSLSSLIASVLVMTRLTRCAENEKLD